MSGCNCPPRCTNFAHQATVSSSRLSDMMINYYLSQGNNNSEVGRRYVNAVGTRNRVASSLLTDVIGHLENLITMYQRLQAVLAVDLIEHTTSVPGRIYESINTIIQKTQDSLVQFSSQIVEKFAEYYEQNIDFSVKLVLRSAKSVLRNDFYFANIDVNDTDNFNITRVEKVFDYKDALCKAAKDVYDSRNPEANFSTKLYVDRTCQGLFFYFCIVDDPATTMRNNTDYIEGLINLYREIAKTARSLLRCAPMYRMFLNEVQSWLKIVLTMNSSLPLQSTDRRYVLAELEHELDWLNLVSRTFAEKTVVRSFVYTVDYRECYL